MPRRGRLAREENGCKPGQKALRHRWARVGAGLGLTERIGSRRGLKRERGAAIVEEGAGARDASVSCEPAAAAEPRHVACPDADTPFPRQRSEGGRDFGSARARDHGSALPFGRAAEAPDFRAVLRSEMMGERVMAISRNRMARVWTLRDAGDRTIAPSKAKNRVMLAIPAKHPLDRGARRAARSLEPAIAAFYSVA